jgi:hypothetical protein
MSESFNWNDEQFAALSELPVPPVPRDFGKQLHDGINRAIVTEQLADSVVSGLPGAAWELFQALLGGAAWSLQNETREERSAVRRG